MQILLIEGRALIRESLNALLGRVEEGALIRQAASLWEGLTVYSELGRPDIVVVGTDLGDYQPVDGVRAIRGVDAQARIVALTADEATGTDHVLTQAGALECVPVTQPSRAFFAVLRRATSGVAGGRRAEDRRPMRTATLTRRQREVLDLMGRGLSNRELGERLGVSEGTVKVHISAIYRILDVGNRVQALAQARKMGLLA